LLEIPAARPTPGCLLLVITSGDITVGLLADSVVAVHHLADSLTPTPAANAGRGQPWVRGVDTSLSLHLDVDLLLAEPRLAMNAEAVE
ncbi:chemotaxis protein CheW, partial [Oscillochloris sp. ZM17-4]|nr:chemotaxis protein CheW [Oscillochloris sp. ZM17-4]